jgi:hypothetical protein
VDEGAAAHDGEGKGQHGEVSREPQQEKQASQGEGERSAEQAEAERREGNAHLRQRASEGVLLRQSHWQGKRGLLPLLPPHELGQRGARGRPQEEEDSQPHQQGRS